MNNLKTIYYEKIIVSACVALFLTMPVVHSTAAPVEEAVANCFAVYLAQYEMSISFGYSQYDAQGHGMEALANCVNMQ